MGVAFFGVMHQACLAGPLQELIDSAKDNATIKPPAGTYTEHVLVSRPVTIDGSAGVVIDGGGKGTVLEIATNGATLRNVTLRGSGHLHTQIDAALRIKGDFNAVKDVTIQNSLFGIDLHQANNNIIRRVHIDGSELPQELRGDSVRFWYSGGNEISDSQFVNSRDFVVWYSSGNTIAHNVIRDSRYGIHFMYGHKNTITDNEISHCDVGTFLMYSNDNQFRGNKIIRAWGASGMGFGLKDTSGTLIENNEVIGNAVGISLDLSPSDPDNPNVFRANRIAYNGIGISFNNDWEGNVFDGNVISSNFTQVAVGGGGSATREVWKNNYWDDYSGFDRDHDGRGDSPYEIYNYADQIWMDVPATAFFRGALSMELLNFIERLAPFSEPRLLLREDDVSTVPEIKTSDAKPKSALEMLQ